MSKFGKLAARTQSGCKVGMYSYTVLSNSIDADVIAVAVVGTHVVQYAVVDVPHR